MMRFHVYRAGRIDLGAMRHVSIDVPVDDHTSKVVYCDYKERITNGISEFSADTSVGRWSLMEIQILTTGDPTVLHYVSYSRYSWQNWLADLRGLLTVMMSLFLLLS